MTPRRQPSARELHEASRLRGKRRTSSSSNIERPAKEARHSTPTAPRSRYASSTRGPDLDGRFINGGAAQHSERLSRVGDGSMMEVPSQHATSYSTRVSAVPACNDSHLSTSATEQAPLDIYEARLRELQTEMNEVLHSALADATLHQANSYYSIILEGSRIIQQYVEPKIYPNSRGWNSQRSEDFDDIHPTDIVEYQDVKPWSPNVERTSANIEHCMHGPHGCVYSSHHYGVMLGYINGNAQLVPANGYTLEELIGISHEEAPLLAVLLDEYESLPIGCSNVLNVIRTAGYDYSKYSVLHLTKKWTVENGYRLRKVAGELTEEGCDFLDREVFYFEGLLDAQRTKDCRLLRQGLKGGGYTGPTDSPPSSGQSTAAMMDTFALPPTADQLTRTNGMHPERVKHLFADLSGKGNDTALVTVMNRVNTGIGEVPAPRTTKAGRSESESAEAMNDAIKSSLARLNKQDEDEDQRIKGTGNL